MKSAMISTQMARAIVGLIFGLMALAGPATAQENLFAPAIQVNGEVITRYELNQRIAFMTVLNQPGDLSAQARQSLIDDKLRRHAAKVLDLSVSPEAVTAGMGEFASRAKLTSEEFVKAIAQGGVEPEAFRDFVEAGMLWREVVKARIAPTVKVSDAEIDRAIAAGAAAGGEVKVLLSEIVIPTGTPMGDAMEIATRLKLQTHSEDGFSIAARLYSKADTARTGGKLDWVNLSELPAEVAARVRALKPGEITDPIPAAGAVRLYMLRDISQGAGDAPLVNEVDYARFLVPEGSDLAALRAAVDTCDDLYTQARGLPVDRLTRETVAEGALPAGVAQELRQLDAGESSTALRESGYRVFLMLCKRAPRSEVPPSRDEVRGQLANRKIALLAEAYLEKMRSEAILRDY